MQLVRVKPKFQITIPTSLREQVGICVGDMLEVKAKSDGTLTLIVKIVTDRQAAV